MITEQFATALPVTETRMDSPTVQISAQIKGNQITITDLDLIGRNARQRTYQVTAIDEQNFQVPDDLDRTTINMLIGVSQRIMYLKHWGFEREP